MNNITKTQELLGERNNHSEDSIIKKIKIGRNGISLLVNFNKEERTIIKDMVKKGTAEYTTVKYSGGANSDSAVKLKK